MDDTLLDKIRQEIAFVYSVQKMHRFEGEMRLFSLRDQQHWKSQEPGFELWFNEETLDATLDKLSFFYRDGREDNTPLLLDPLVYKRDGDGPKAEGTGLVWASVFCREGEEVPEETFARIRQLGAFVSYVKQPDNARAGLKIFAILKEPLSLENVVFDPSGMAIDTCLNLAELADIHSDDVSCRHWLLSGLTYHSPRGDYQHPDFSDLLEGKNYNTSRDFQSRSVHASHVQNAAICWEAYHRDPILYNRYGVDVSNLDRNLKGLQEVNSAIDLIRHELALIWQGHQRHGLEGYMRLYTNESQEHWRSKQAGVEIWFGPDELDEAIKKLQEYYNGGLLPNSPLLLDPVIYSKSEEGSYTPLGTGVIWATALSTGAGTYSPDASERLGDLGAAFSSFLRAGEVESGAKIVGFLDKPIQFDDAQKAAPHNSIEAMHQLFGLADTNAETMAPYYLLSGMEYLSTSGAFTSKSLANMPLETPQAREDFIAAHTVSLGRIDDAYRCWEGYERQHPLWQHFGIDKAHLEKNLEYFNLCGRDYQLLKMLSNSAEEKEETFDFLVPGWIPKATVTVIGGTGNTGKSTLAHRLALLLATNWEEEEADPVWLGSEIKKDALKGLVMYFSGEDNAAIINTRAEVVDPDKRASRLMVKYGAELGADEHGNKMNFEGFLAQLRKLPEILAVIIDPARAYISNEQDSESVTAFFKQLEAFAEEKHCAVIVTHHLVKEAHPKDTRDILDLLDGPRAFTDYPRVVIGLVRDDAHTFAGLAKNTIPVKLGMVEGERIFAHDPDTLDLVWLPGEKGVRSFTASKEELQKLKEGKQGSEEE